jgi:hypothetical protein
MSEHAGYAIGVIFPWDMLGLSGPGKGFMVIFDDFEDAEAFAESCEQDDIEVYDLATIDDEEKEPWQLS